MDATGGVGHRTGGRRCGGGRAGGYAGGGGAGPGARDRLECLRLGKRQEALAQCPQGTRVLGGGGYIEGGERRVHLVRLQALGSSDQFAAGAEEYGSFGQMWRVTSYAICGQAPRGLEYRSFSTGRAPAAFKEAEAHCSPGKRVISTGGRVYGGGGHVALVTFWPAPDYVLAEGAVAEASDGGEWMLWSHAVCADLTEVANHYYGTGVPDSQDKVRVSTCPPGTDLYGLGGRLQSPISGKAFYAAAYPDAALTAVTTDAREYPGGTTDEWGSITTAICVS
jgi:hypothetical protein